MSVNSLLQPLNTSNPNVWTNLYANSINANSIIGNSAYGNISWAPSAAVNNLPVSNTSYNVIDVASGGTSNNVNILFPIQIPVPGVGAGYGFTIHRGGKYLLNFEMSLQTLVSTQVLEIRPTINNVISGTCFVQSTVSPTLSNISLNQIITFNTLDQIYIFGKFLSAADSVKIQNFSLSLTQIL